MEYKASLDTIAKIITACVFVLLGYLGYQSTLGIIAEYQDLPSFLENVCTLVFCVALLGGCYGYAPQKYILNDDSLVINRLFKDVIINLNEMEEVRLLGEEKFPFTWRTFGVGGLFGYFGKFYNSKHGSMTWYATKRKGRVLILTKQGKKIIITPDDASIVEAINKVIA